MSENYENPRKVNPIKSPAFKKYLSVSCVAILVIVAGVLLIWLAGAPRMDIPDDIYFLQLDTPADDAPVVVFETNMGTMKAVLYPDEAPAYCEYFMELVNSGYYDGTYICAIADSAYALGGTKFQDPNTTESPDSDTTQIEAEISNNLWPIKGALSSFIGTGGMWPFDKNYAGSTILFINDIDDAYMAPDALKRSYGEKLGGVFDEKGGIPNFARKYTIFGQIYDGWDVYESIMGAQVLETNQPASEIVFERVYISTYGENLPE